MASLALPLLVQLHLHCLLCDVSAPYTGRPYCKRKKHRIGAITHNNSYLLKESCHNIFERQHAPCNMNWHVTIKCFLSFCALKFFALIHLHQLKLSYFFYLVLFTYSISDHYSLSFLHVKDLFNISRIANELDIECECKTLKGKGGNRM